MSDQIPFRCNIYRGGTSKALFFMKNELPSDTKLRESVLLAIFGSPDVRQIDGLGGSDITTSKAAIISPSKRHDADVDYTFAQVLIDRAEVSYQGNCGNISSAVGPFAIDQGLAEAQEPVSIVLIFNTNTNSLLIAEVPVIRGKAATEGDYSIAGVPGTGGLIKIDYEDTAGSATGKLLPTGNPVDITQIEGIGQIEFSIVDAANPVVFVNAQDVGVTGKENRNEISQNQKLLDKLEKIRGMAAEKIGLISDRNQSRQESPLIPQIAFVSPATDYIDYGSGKIIKKSEISFLARVVFNQMPTDTYTGTGSICTAAAALIKDTVVNKVASQETKKTGKVFIGHARGSMEIDAAVENTGGEWLLKKAIMKRTARRMMEGQVFIRQSVLE
jgi:methylitaconate Delta-isomerase